MARVVQADYLVVGAGAAGMAFTDALIDHSNVRVALVDRRHCVGGHWLEDYPFIRLHQASALYGVASTLLGGGRVQRHGPEAGLHERAGVSEICAYFAHVLSGRMLESGRVEFFAKCEYLADGQFESLISGQRFEVPPGCRIVDARYLSPSIPANTPPPFDVEPGARVVPVNVLAVLDEAPRQYVVVGSGKTASDACIWLLARGVDAGSICWVRPREPWMLNRAVVQPDPSVFLGTAADIMEAAATATSLEELFLRMEDAGIMIRIDRSVAPTMAKAPTLANWELEQLRTIPIWGRPAITLQPIRAGFPCFGAALAGYVEATRDDDAEKNRLCPATPYPDTVAGWAAMHLLGTRAAMSFGSEPDIKAWAESVAINPAALPPERERSPALQAVLDRMKIQVPRGLEGLARLS